MEKHPSFCKEHQPFDGKPPYYHFFTDKGDIPLRFFCHKEVDDPLSDDYNDMNNIYKIEESYPRIADSLSYFASQIFPILGEDTLILT